MAAIASALVGPITSLLGGLFSSGQATKAANAEQTGANNAKNVILGNQNQALGIEQNTASTNAANEQPFLQAGQSAIGSLSQLLQNGSLTPAQFQAPTAAQAEANPGYQFSLQQGEQALQNSAAASGGLLTGGTAKALNNYAQGAASQNYQQVYNNAVTNYQLGTQAQQQQYNQLAGVAGLGLNSAGELGQVGTALSGQQAGTLATGGQEQAAQIDAAAQAQAAGIVGSTNALTSGIFGATAGLGSTGSGGLSSILQSLGIGSGGGASGYGGGSTSSSPSGLWDFSQGAPPQGFARGGQVRANKPIIIGEQGPELFIPDSGGMILPNEFLHKGSLRALLARRAA